jgi:putative ABC transport system permease protein
MPVSAIEGTRETGTRMGICANHRAILAQFLLEALVICMIRRGLIGVAIGIGGRLGRQSGNMLSRSPFSG